MSEKVGEARTHLSILANRPKSTYGNRALSINHRAELDTKDWVPKQVLADCLKRKLSWEHESDNVTADQFAMQYVKLGDRVIFELTVDGKTLPFMDNGHIPCNLVLRLLILRHVHQRAWES